MDICYLLDHEGRDGLKTHHYIGMVLILALGYYLGTKYPSLLSKVTG